MIAIPQKYYDFLTTELDTWTDQEIITAQQADDIISLYEARTHSLRKILLIAGGVLLLLGGVSFLAAKWHTIPKLLRSCVIVLGYAGSMCGYFFTGRSTSRTGKSLLLLASLIFGSGIYLITRMYDYKLEYHEVLILWQVQLLLTTFFTHDDWQIYFTQAISLLYLLMINAIDIFALEFMGSARVSVSAFFEPYRAWMILVALWVVCTQLRDRVALNVNMLLTLLVLASRLSLCFGGTWTLIILSLGGAVLSFIHYGDAEVLGLMVLGLSGLMLTWPGVWQNEFSEHAFTLSVMTAILTACVMLMNIKRGHTALGISFCVILIVRYFFDRLFGYASKAWTFTLLGVVFVALGIYFSPSRRHNDS